MHPQVVLSEGVRHRPSAGHIYMKRTAHRANAGGTCPPCGLYRLQSCAHLAHAWPRLSRSTDPGHSTFTGLPPSS